MSILLGLRNWFRDDPPTPDEHESDASEATATDDSPLDITGKVNERKLFSARRTRGVRFWGRCGTPGGAESRSWEQGRMLTTAFRPRARVGWLGPFLVFNLILLLGFAARYAAAGGLSLTPLAGLFFATMASGHMTTLGLLALLPAVVAIAILPKTRLAPPLAAVGMSALVGYLLLDLRVYQLYRFHVNAAILDMIFSDAATDIFVFSWATYTKAAGAAAGLVAAEWLLAQALWRRSLELPGRRRPWVALLFITAALHHGLYALSDAVSYVPVTRQASLLPAYFPSTVGGAARTFGWTAVASAASQPGETDLMYPRRPLDCQGPVRPTNLLVVAIDSWRYDMLAPDVTPALFSLAARAARFENHTSGGSATRTGIFTLFYGLTANYWHAFLHERRGPVLIDALLNAGYQMGVFGSAPLTSPEFDRTVFARVPHLRLRSGGEAAYQRDQDITDGFRVFLAARDPARPFFGFLFYDAPHAFSVPPGRRGRFQPALDAPDYLALNQHYDPVPFRNLYKNSVAFDDELIGRVLDDLDRLHLRDDTVVVVTGDHGQEFNENGKNYWGHSGNFTRYQTGVPLLVAWPGRPAARFTQQTNHIDLAPTLLAELFRCVNPASDYALGVNLFQAPARRTFLLGNYGEEALLREGRLTLVHPYGGLEEVDGTLSPIPGRPHDPEVFREFLRQQSAFFRPHGAE